MFKYRFRENSLFATYIIFHIDVPNVFDHSPMACFTSLKVANTANTIFKCYLHRAAVNVVNSLLDVLSKRCLRHGILLVFVVRYAISSLRIVDLFAIETELYVMNAMQQIKQFCQAGIYVSSASM